MGYYSFVAIASQEAHFPQHLLSLDQGLNVFSALVDDVTRFQRELQEAGVTVQQCYQISEDLDPMPAPMFLPQGQEPPPLPIQFRVDK